MMFAQIDWTTVITIALGVVGSLGAAFCSLAQVYLRHQAAGMERRILALEEQTARCEAERNALSKSDSEKTAMLNTEWPSDDFNHEEVVAKIKRAASDKGIKITLAQIGVLIRGIRDRTRNNCHDPKLDGEFFL